jgi:hypothetical protein
LAHEKKAKNDTTKDSINLEVEEMKTFGKIQADEHANRLKVLEVQKKLSAEKIEQAKLAHLAAKEQREAAEVQREVKKLELQTKMLETYNNLLAVDVSLMSEEDKLDHTNTLRCFKKKIFDV